VILDWWALDLELAAWRRAGRLPCLWWRDDDAVAATPALRRLLKIAGPATPLALAVIPEKLQPSLFPLVNAAPSVVVLQHGVDHVPARADGPPSQFPADTAPEAVADRLTAAASTMVPLRRRLPVYVPPWNDLQANVAEALPRAGFAGVSGFNGEGPSPDGLARIDVHLDLLRWSPRPRFRGEGRFLRRMTRLLRARRQAQRWMDPIGLLTHHLDHDEAAWRFLEALLSRASLPRGCWRSAAGLFGLEPRRAPRPTTTLTTLAVAFA